MPLIDETYFVLKLGIPNSNKNTVLERLNLCIKIYEKKFLTELLGYQLYVDFTTGLAATPIDAKWSKLLSGADYQYNQRTIRFNGLVRPDERASIIANYVYCQWMENENTQTTTAGEVATKTDNSERVTPNYKIISAWNEMVKGVWDMVSFLDTNPTDYPNWSLYGDTNNSNYIMGYNLFKLKDIFYPKNSLGL